MGDFKGMPKRVRGGNVGLKGSRYYLHDAKPTDGVIGEVGYPVNKEPKFKRVKRKILRGGKSNG